MSITRHKTRIASHRGGSYLWPENSPTAFRRTAELGVEQVEFDVHLSADDALVVMHDAMLDRTTEATGPVRARSLEELRRIRLKGTNGETVPTFSEVAAIFRPTPITLRVEMKADVEGHPYPGIVPRLLAALEEAGMAQRTVLTSFLAPIVAEVARDGRLPGQVIWLLSLRNWQEVGLTGAIAAARSQGIGGLGLHQSVCDAAAVAEVRQAGLSCGAWAVNHESSIRRMLELGVDVFTTDDPVLALRLRG